MSRVFRAGIQGIAILDRANDASCETMNRALNIGPKRLPESSRAGLASASFLFLHSPRCWIMEQDVNLRSTTNGNSKKLHSTTLKSQNPRLHHPYSSCFGQDYGLESSNLDRSSVPARKVIYFEFNEDESCVSRLISKSSVL